MAYTVYEFRIMVATEHDAKDQPIYKPIESALLLGRLLIDKCPLDLVDTPELLTQTRRED